VRAFAVRDKALLGRGIFALFSTVERAEQYLRGSTGIVRQCGEVTELAVVAKSHDGFPSTVFAAYFYDDLHDSHIFDGLYEDSGVAFDIAGRKGHVVEFVIDSPEVESRGRRSHC
jgi:hypothetical protein